MSGLTSVASLIDESPLSRLQKRIIALTVLLAAVEGFDSQIMGFLAPAITSEWQLGVADFTVVFTVGIVGMIVGAVLVAPFADRYGRRIPLIGGILVIGVFTALGASATSLTMLCALRFVVGIGVGVASPTVVSLLSEFVPRRVRATIVMCVVSSMSVGAFIGGLGAAWMIPNLGWQAVMLSAGALTIALGAVALWGLPESITFLVARDRVDAARSSIAKIAPQRAAEIVLAAGNGPTDVQPKTSISAIMRGGSGVNTLLLWAAFMLSLMVTYFVMSWLPSLFTQAGLSQELAVSAVSVASLGGVFGGVAMGFLTDRLRLRFGVLSIGLLVSALSIAVAVANMGRPVVMLLALFFVGFGALGCQIGLWAMAPQLYPTVDRATGVGWASGVGRIGSLAGPIIGGALVAGGVAPTALFALAAVPITLCAVVIAVLARRLATGPGTPMATVAPAAADVSSSSAG